jgi:hypothetical protein
MRLAAPSTRAEAETNLPSLRGPFGKLRAGSEGPLFHGGIAGRDVTAMARVGRLCESQL